MERYYNFKYSFHLNNLFFLKNNPPSFLKNRFFDLKSMREIMRENFSSTSTELSACHLVQKGKKESKHDFPTLVIILLLSIFAGGSNYRLIRRFESWQ